MTQELVFLSLPIATIVAIVTTIIYCRWWEKEKRTKEKKIRERNKAIKFFKIVNS